MRFEAHLPRHEAAASVSKPAPLKSLKKRSYKKLRKSKGLLSAGEAEELLRQRCRGIWSDSDEDLASRTILAPEVSQTGDAHVNTSKSAGDTNTFSKCPLIKHGGKGRKSMSDGPHNEAPEKSDEPAARSTSRSCHNSPQAQHHGGFETGAQGNTEEHYWERQRLQTRNTGGAPQSSSCTSKSLQRLKELGGFATLCPSKKEIGKGESRGRKITDKESAQQAKDAQKVFDETVQKIRNMVYPHLGRFQRRQFVTTALRALGIGSTKTQKMPLPELRSRKKATAAAIKARRDEAKILGVSSHIDSHGSVQQAARNRSKVVAQKQRRKHLRETFKGAGKYSSKLM